MATGTGDGGLTPARAGPSWRTLIFIVLGNLIPVAGVIFLGWNATQILILYWCENVVIGALTLPRILSAQVVLPTPPPERGTIQIPLNTTLGKGCMGCFFVVHYGIFCLVHGVFAVAMVAGFMGGERGWAGGIGSVWPETFGDGDFRLALLILVFVQLVIFVREWWLSGLWKRSDPGTEMFRPYGRIIVMHLTVLFGAGALTAIGAPASAVLTLCLVKTVIEIAAEFPRKTKSGETADSGHDYEV